MSEQITEIFMAFQKFMDDEQLIRETVRNAVQNLEQTGRQILAILQTIHQENGVKNYYFIRINVAKQIAAKGKLLFEQIRLQFAALSKVVPSEQYYKYHDHWRFITQRLCFLIAFIFFIETGEMLTKSEAAKTLNLQPNRSPGSFHLDIEDYLMGLLQMASELSRYAVNSVTAGDYEMPSKISAFMSELDAGFRLLNLKNDSLRKRFDGLKYDIRKIEEVVYDIKIRNLNQIKK